MLHVLPKKPLLGRSVEDNFAICHTLRLATKNLAQGKAAQRMSLQTTTTVMLESN